MKGFILMTSNREIAAATLAVAALLLTGPEVAGAQDKDAAEVQRYVLSDAALAKYSAATKNLAALPRGDCTDDDSESQSIDQVAAKLAAAPGAKAAVQSAGMTPREYVVFSLSLFQNGLAAWALDQPGGKLPPGVSKANVDFVKRHGAELKRLEGVRPDGGCEGEDSGEDTAE